MMLIRRRESSEMSISISTAIDIVGRSDVLRPISATCVTRHAAVAARVYPWKKRQACSLISTSAENVDGVSGNGRDNIDVRLAPGVPDDHLHDT
jgi:hypothetical protein